MNAVHTQVDVSQKASEFVSETTKFNDLAGIVAEAALMINANPGDEKRVGEVMKMAVCAAGGTAAASFAVSKALTKFVPIGSRHLRKYYRQYLRSTRVAEAAGVIQGMLVGDSATDLAPIGKEVESVVNDMLGTNPVATVALLAARLNSIGASTSSAFLCRCQSAYLVSRLGGEKIDTLAKLMPAQYSATALPVMVKLIENCQPWVGSSRIQAAADLIIKRHAQLKRQFEKIVSDVLASEARKAAKVCNIDMLWYIPPKSGRGKNGLHPSNACMAV
jgi:hypothetical protein